MGQKRFQIDPIIEQNSLYIKNLTLSSLYLKYDKDTPWFVLVPRKIDLIELIDLTHEEQAMLMEEVTLVSEFLKEHFSPYKLNVGSLGNIVPQLHIHVIGRTQSDRAWPGPVWGVAMAQVFSEEEMHNLKKLFLDWCA